MQCPKCGSATWFGDKCAGCGRSRVEETEPETKPATKPATPKS